MVGENDVEKVCMGVMFWVEVVIKGIVDIGVLNVGVEEFFFVLFLLFKFVIYFNVFVIEVGYYFFGVFFGYLDFIIFF